VRALLHGRNDLIPNEKLDSWLEIVIASDLAEVRRVLDEIEGALLYHRYDEKEIFSIKLALEEAVVNAIKHGNQMDHTKTVRIHYRAKPERIDIRILDEGKGFNPENVPDPTAEANLERPCGRGLLLVRNYMTEVVFDPPGNRVVMCKLRNRCHSSAYQGSGNV
jgi:serine/threonine-protein kinase RsbW